MVYLFSSEGCPACEQIHREFKNGRYEDWASHVIFVDIRYCKEDQCSKAYIDGKQTEGRAPVDAVPALYDPETDQVIYGYQNIKDRLAHGYKSNRD